MNQDEDWLLLQDLNFALKDLDALTNVQLCLVQFHPEAEEVHKQKAELVYWRRRNKAQARARAAPVRKDIPLKASAVEHVKPQPAAIQESQDPESAQTTENPVSGQHEERHDDTTPLPSQTLDTKLKTELQTTNQAAPAEPNPAITATEQSFEAVSHSGDEQALKQDTGRSEALDAEKDLTSELGLSHAPPFPDLQLQEDPKVQYPPNSVGEEVATVVTRSLSDLPERDEKQTPHSSLDTRGEAINPDSRALGKGKTRQDSPSTRYDGDMQGVSAVASAGTDLGSLASRLTKVATVPNPSKSASPNHSSTMPSVKRKRDDKAESTTPKDEHHPAIRAKSNDGSIAAYSQSSKPVQQDKPVGKTAEAERPAPQQPSKTGSMYDEQKTVPKECLQGLAGLWIGSIPNPIGNTELRPWLFASRNIPKPVAILPLKRAGSGPGYIRVFFQNQNQADKAMEVLASTPLKSSSGDAASPLFKSAVPDFNKFKVHWRDVESWARDYLSRKAGPARSDSPHATSEHSTSAAAVRPDSVKGVSPKPKGNYQRPAPSGDHESHRLADRLNNGQVYDHREDVRKSKGNNTSRQRSPDCRARNDEDSGRNLLHRVREYSPDTSYRRSRPTYDDRRQSDDRRRSSDDLLKRFDGAPRSPRRYTPPLRKRSPPPKQESPNLLGRLA